jgi:lactate dehydrogenase-like 2-hydroxyacid dehydrogenase
MLYELEGKMLGIVGLGNIGKKVARHAQAFHMRVQYYDVARLRGDAERRARRALCAVSRAVVELGHRQFACAARQIDPQIDRGTNSG